jgi:hypothetical protein
MWRITGLLGLVGTACVVATSAPAAPEPTLFRLTVTGIARHQWTFTSAPRVVGLCSRTEMTEGIRTTRFRTAQPIVVRLSGGRLLSTELRGIAGTVTLAGANTIDEQCEGVGTSRIEDCVQTRRSFSGAGVRVSSPRRGFVALGPARRVRLARSDCPLEPADVRRRPFGPAMSPLRIPKEALAEEKVASITMRATRSATTTYGPPEDGRLQERVEWKLAFVRVKR